MIDFRQFQNDALDEFIALNVDLKNAGARFFVLLSLVDCEACEELALSISDLANVSDFETRIEVIGISIKTIRDLRRLNLHINGFPTLLEYRGEKLVYGWSGVPMNNNKSDMPRMLSSIFGGSIEPKDLT